MDKSIKRADAPREPEILGFEVSARHKGNCELCRRVALKYMRQSSRPHQLTSARGQINLCRQESRLIRVLQLCTLGLGLLGNVFRKEASPSGYTRLEKRSNRSSAGGVRGSLYRFDPMCRPYICYLMD